MYEGAHVRDEYRKIFCVQTCVCFVCSLVGSAVKSFIVLCVCVCVYRATVHRNEHASTASETIAHAHDNTHTHTFNIDNEIIASQ